MILIISMLIAYLVGSIPTGFLIAKYKTNTDLRGFGSGSVGATNVFRAAGKLAALVTLILDILKGYIAVTVLSDMLYSFRLGVSLNEYCAIMGFCAVVGHNWPIFLRFKGGKGVATSAGVLLGISPLLVLIGLCAWLVVFIFTRVVSISSIVAAVVIPISAYMVGNSTAVRMLAIALALLMVIRHHGNIKRIAKGEEKKISVRI